MFAFQHENVAPGSGRAGQGTHRRLSPRRSDARLARNLRRFPRRLRRTENFFSRPQLHRQCPRLRRRAGQSQDLRNRKDPATTIPSCSGALAQRAAKFWDHPNVGDVRQEGLICAIEIVRDFKTRQPFPFADRIGHRICEAARAHGLLTRPVGDVLVLMPPYCVTENQIAQMVNALWLGLNEVLPVWRVSLRSDLLPIVTS